MNPNSAPRSWLSQLVPVAALALVLMAVLRAQETVSLVLLALLVSYLVRGVVDLLPARIPRGLAAALVLVLILLAAAGFAVWFVPQLAHEVEDLVRNFPKLSAEALKRARGFRQGLVRALPESWMEALDAQVGRLGTEAGQWVLDSARSLLATLPRLISLVVVPVLAFYLVKDGTQILAYIMNWVPRSRREFWDRMALALDETMIGYIRGQSLVCLAQAAQCTLAFSLLGVPYAAVLGTLAGLAETLPFVGSTVVMVLITLVALPEGPEVWARGLIAYIVLNQFLNYLIIPRIMKSHLSMHPLAVLLAVGAGAELAGFYGVLFALPAVAGLTTALRVWRESRAAD